VITYGKIEKKQSCARNHKKPCKKGNCSHKSKCCERYNLVVEVTCEHKDKKVMKHIIKLKANSISEENELIRKGVSTTQAKKRTVVQEEDADYVDERSKRPRRGTK